MKIRKVTYYSMIISTIFLVIYFTYNMLSTPYIGLNVQKNETGEWEVVEVSPNGWAAQKGIKENDVISEINGAPLEMHPTVTKYLQVEKAKTLSVKRNNDILSYDVDTKLALKTLFFHVGLPLVYIVTLLSFCLFLKKKRNLDSTSMILVLFLLTFGISIYSAGASARTDDLGKIFTVTTFLYIPVLFLDFFYRYFEEKGIILFSKKALPFLYIMNGVLSVVQALSTIFPFGKYYLILRIIEPISFSITFLFAFVIFLKNFVVYRKTPLQPIFKLLSVAIILAFGPYVFLFVVPMMLVHNPLISGELAGLFTFVLPFTLFYLITVNRLFDINYYINRFYYYFLLAFAPSIVISLLILYFQTHLEMVEFIQLGLLIYVVIVCFLYGKEELNHRFGTKLFFQKNNFNTRLHDFIRILSETMKKTEIEEHIIKEFKSVLSLKNVAFFEFDKYSRDMILKGGTIPDSNELNKKLQGTPTYNIGTIYTLDNGFFTVLGNTQKKMYILWLDEKKNHTLLNKQEKQWIQAISYYVSISIENIEKIEDLLNITDQSRRNFKTTPMISRVLFNIQEKERRRLATDLHDAALQVQIMWYRKLGSVLDENTFTPEVKGDLINIKEGLLDVIHEIRETCNELRPTFLIEWGLIDSLERLIKTAQLRNTFIVNLDITQFKISISDDLALIIYRIIQELLSNASKHSQASVIDITLSRYPESIFLNYQDNGVGLDPNSSKKNGIGLSGIKERVHSVEGLVDISSGHKGLEILIEIPEGDADYEHFISG